MSGYCRVRRPGGVSDQQRLPQHPRQPGGVVRRRRRPTGQPGEAAVEAGGADSFLARMRAEACVRLLEIGAGTGQDSAYFASQSFEVVDFHVVTTTGEHGFQSLTLLRPGREAARSMTR